MNPRRRKERLTRRSTAWAWLGALCLAGLLGCAGGSGSSGFDIVENAAIDQSLDEQRCVESGGLVICPADTESDIDMPPSPSPSPRQTPTATPPPFTPTSTPTPVFAGTTSPTPTPEGPDNTPPSDTPIANRTITATRTATQPAPPPTATKTNTLRPSTTATPTRTATPAGMRIDIGLDRTTLVDCMIVSDTCGFSFAFTARGFGDGTSFLVASRRIVPESAWQISVPVAVESPPGAPSFDALITIPVDEGEEAIALQVAVLAQSGPVDAAPASVDFLGESAAEFAFVTPELEARPIR